MSVPTLIVLFWFFSQLAPCKAQAASNSTNLSKEGTIASHAILNSPGNAAETKHKWNTPAAPITAAQHEMDAAPGTCSAWDSTSPLLQTRPATATTRSGVSGEESTGADVQPLGFAANPRCFSCLIPTQCQCQPLRRRLICCYPKPVSVHVTCVT